MSETLLFIPGLLSDQTAWQPVRGLLGQGSIADLGDQDSINGMAADLLAAHPGPLAVAGHSMGARVALEMHRQAPARISRLALLDTGTHPAKPGEEVNRLRRIRLGYEQGMAALCRDWLPPMLARANQTRNEITKPLTEMVLRQTPERHENQIRALLNRPDARAELSSITCPTLILVGAEDQWSPPAQHREINAAIPGSTLVIIKCAGHFAPFEAPAETARLMKAWLAA